MWKPSYRGLAYLACSNFLGRAVVLLGNFVYSSLNYETVVIYGAHLDTQILLFFQSVFMIPVFLLGCLVFLGIEKESFNLVLYPTLMLLFLFLLRYTGELALIIIHWEEYKRIHAPSLLYNFLVDLFCIGVLLAYIYFNLARPPVQTPTCFPYKARADVQGPNASPYFLVPSCLHHQTSPSPVPIDISSKVTRLELESPITTSVSNRQCHVKESSKEEVSNATHLIALAPETKGALTEVKVEQTRPSKKLASGLGLEDAAVELVKKARKKEEENNWKQSLVYPPKTNDVEVKAVVAAAAPMIVGVEKKGTIKSKTDCEQGKEENVIENKSTEPAFEVTYEIKRPKSQSLVVDEKSESQSESEKNEEIDENAFKSTAV